MKSQGMNVKAPGKKCEATLEEKCEAPWGGNVKPPGEICEASRGEM